MKKLLYVSVLLSFISYGTINAQKKPVVKFEKLEHDFGKIKEEGGNVKYRFIFTNQGDDTLKLLSVKPGCGCTPVDWTKTGVMPKKSGYIDVEYNPKGRPGVFNKGVAVTTNDPTMPSLSLTVKGEVLPKEKTIADLYPVVMGNLRLVNSNINLGNVNNTEVRTDTLKLYNEWNKPMNIGFGALPVYMQAKAIPEVLKPKQKGIILVTYDVTKRNEFGYVFDQLLISTNDSLQAEKRLHVSLNINEDFSKLTPAELADAPIMKFENTTYNFDKAKQGEKVECTFVFKNEGVNDLIIRKVKASCGCTGTNPEKTILKKGESSKITATFNTAGRTGKQYKTVTVISNDPVNSTVSLTLEGTVEAPASGETPQK